MNKRDAVLSLLDPTQTPPYVPAAFFLHFASWHQKGQAAVDKHLEYFRYTGMDFVKIQYELVFPANPEIQTPEDWAKIPVYDPSFFEDPLRIAQGLVKAVKSDALIVHTLYSPFMVAGQVVGDRLAEHIRQNPQAVKRGMEHITQSLINFVRALKEVGVDGFYTSTQGAEAGRFEDSSLFDQCVRPYDMALMEEANRKTIFNILHICDYHLPYADLSSFLDYPGQVVNCSLEMVNGSVTARQVADSFQRPFMGGLLRKGILARGTTEEVREAAQRALQAAPPRFILAADCTVPSDTPWDNLRTAIATAHQFKR